MVTVHLYSSTKTSIEHQFVIISITHTKWWCISDSKKIVFWTSLQKVWNGCKKYINVPTWNSKAHNDYNMRSWNAKKRPHTHTRKNPTNCGALHWSISHQAVYTSLWSSVTLRVPLSTTCWWKKWLVHVGVLNPVWKIFIIVFTSLKV